MDIVLIFVLALLFSVGGLLLLLRGLSYQGQRRFLFILGSTIMIGLGISVLWVSAPTYDTVTETYDLVAFVDGSHQEGRISGIFLLGSGGVSGSLTEGWDYIYYVKTERGIAMQKTDVMGDNVFIHEDNSSPHLVKTIEKPAPRHWWTQKSMVREKLVSYDFFLPPNTVVRQYRADLDVK